MAETDFDSLVPKEGPPPRKNGLMVRVDTPQVKHIRHLIIVIRAPPRIDIPGVLSHVLVRGIERRPIFSDDFDRSFFVERLGRLLAETGADCLAWALMTNHAHLLLRPRAVGLTPLMRRLLTAHALRYNLRHRRAGYLFQNRFKSLPCEEQGYLLALVRYIHLNPYKAGMFTPLEDLDRYPWTGHAALMGNKALLAGQAIGEVLALFASGQRAARRRCRKFMGEGMGQVEGATSTHSAERPPLGRILKETAATFRLAPDALCRRERGALVAQARIELCRRAIGGSGCRASELLETVRGQKARKQDRPLFLSFQSASFPLLIPKAHP
jgi:REP element-mobilizing transposase RayT